MTYLYQFAIIAAISYAAEWLNKLIPISIPAGVWGVLLLVLLLQFKVIKLSHVEKAGDFLLEIMPIMFVPAMVGLMESWDILRDKVVAMFITVIVTLIFSMAISGKVSDYFAKKKGASNDE